MRRLLGIGLAAALAATGCSNAPPTPGGGTTRPTYDKKTGRLTQLTFDRPTACPRGPRTAPSVRYGPDDGKPVWGRVSAPDGKVERVEISSTADEQKIDRWEFYLGDLLVRVEEDTNGDSRPDTWETYEGGVLKTTSFDENGDGRPDRRLTYEDGELTLIESEPDAAGNYQKKVAVK